jgi:hypothetical protein
MFSALVNGVWLITEIEQYAFCTGKKIHINNNNEKIILFMMFYINELNRSIIQSIILTVFPKKGIFY